MNLGDLNKVWEIRALKKPGEDEARRILDKVAKQVQPIMSKRKWRVKLLSEFCPKNPALLGLNVGAGIQVKLRLRRPNKEWDFIPFHQVLDTMLHELCHNVHGPHNASFYNLWDELRKECEELMSKGITGTGQGFDLPGRRLGGFSCQRPVSSLRTAAVAAAEKRVLLGSLLPSGPKRLGGDSIIKAALSPIQAAAMAAERRLQDDIWCGSQSADVLGDEENFRDAFEEAVPARESSSGLSDDTCSQHALDVRSGKRTCGSDTSFFPQSSKSNLVDLTEDASESENLSVQDGVRCPKRSCKSHLVEAASSKYRSKSSLIDLSKAASYAGSCPASDAKHAPEESAMWECTTCTLLNSPLAPICELCSTSRPKDRDTKFKMWSCKFCTLENSVELDNCAACGQWRYSYGPPLSTRAPNLGT